MKFLKITLLFYFIVSALFSKAQAPAQFYYDCSGDFLGKDKESIYLYCYGMGKFKISVVNNNDLTTIREMPLPIKTESLIALPEVYMINDKFLILTTDKNKKIIQSIVLDKKGNILEKEKPLYTFRKSTNFRCQLLKNNQLAIIAVNSMDHSNTPIDILMFDEAFSYLYTIPISVSLFNSYTLLSEIKLNGNVLSYLESSRNTKFVYLDFSSKTSRPIDFNLKNDIGDYKIFFNEKINKQMIVLFEEKGIKLKALDLFTIEEDGKIASVVSFPGATIPEIDWGDYIDYVFQDGSGIYLTIESGFANISVLKIGTDYNKEWVAVVKKNQYEANNSSIKRAAMASYFAFLDHENLNIVYNESPDNLKPGLKKLETTTFALGLNNKKIQKTVCVNSKVSKSNGSINTKILYTNDTSPIIYVSGGKHISESNFLFSAWDFKTKASVKNLLQIKN